MKRFFLVGFWIICFLTGCNFGEPEIRVADQHAIAERDVPLKKPVKWEITFINELKGTEETIDLGQYGYDVTKDELDEELLANLAKQFANKIDQPMRNPTIDANGQIVPGQNRVILSEAEFMEKVKSLTYLDKEMVLPIYEEEPTVKVEDLEGIMNFVIGTYTTYFNPNVYGRAVNIELSSKAIDHYVLGPGDEFSFNKVVGERTREKGYQEAYEIINDEFILGIGGGICQTSSTLFNAIDHAGLGVIERHSHTQDIGYVPPNRDATVSWGGLDFKFVNTYDYPVLIKTTVSREKGLLKVDIYSSKAKDLLVKASN